MVGGSGVVDDEDRLGMRPGFVARFDHDAVCIEATTIGTNFTTVTACARSAHRCLALPHPTACPMTALSCDAFELAVMWQLPRRLSVSNAPPRLRARGPRLTLRRAESALDWSCQDSTGQAAHDRQAAPSSVPAGRTQPKDPFAISPGHATSGPGEG